MWIWFSVRFYSLITVVAYRCEELPLNSSEGEKIETCLFAIMLLILFFVVSFAFLSCCQHVLNTADNSVKAKWILFNVFLSSQSSSSSQHITTYTHTHVHRSGRCVKYHWYHWQNTSAVSFGFVWIWSFYLRLGWIAHCLKWIPRYANFSSPIRRAYMITAVIAI